MVLFDAGARVMAPAVAAAAARLGGLTRIVRYDVRQMSDYQEIDAVDQRILGVLQDDALGLAAAQGTAARKNDNRGEHTVSAGFLTVPASRLAAEGEHDLLLEECFGPVTVVARYEDDSEVRGVLSRLTGNLTATVQLSAGEAAVL